VPPPAIDEPNRRRPVGCRRDPSLLVMDSDTGKIVARGSIPGDVDDRSFDARRGRIDASCGEEAIAVVRQVDADRDWDAIKQVQGRPPHPGREGSRGRRPRRARSTRRHSRPSLGNKGQAQDGVDEGDPGRAW